MDVNLKVFPKFSLLFPCVLLFIVGPRFYLVAQSQEKKRAPYGLLCDLVDGTSAEIISNRPAFSWVVPANGKSNVKQIAYQILVSPQLENKEQDTKLSWDSGKVPSDQSAGILYAGMALQPNTTYYWQVRVWTSSGNPSSYSAPFKFRTADSFPKYATTTYPLEKTKQYPEKIERRGKILFADFGKAAFGQLSLRLFSEQGNDTILVHLGEDVDATGKINRRPGGTIRYNHYQIVLRPGTHDYKVTLRKDARNTGATAIKMPVAIGEVTPFRYVEIEHYPHKITAVQVIRDFVHYRFDENTSYFKSSDSVLNQVWELCKYSIKATSFAGIYVDGDRERIPYEADALINQLSHYAVDREFSMARKSHEYLIENATWPTEWIMQSVIMAWNDYLYTADSRSIKQFYIDLKAKTLLALQDKNDLITTDNLNESIKKSIHFSGQKLKDIVDWPQTGTLGLGKEAAGETDGFVFTKYNAVSNAYFYRSLTLMAQIALAIDEYEEASFFQKKAAAVKESYRKHFWNAKTGTYRDGIGTDHSSLHSNFFALAFGLVEENNVPSVVQFIRSRGMACSVYGSQFLLDGLYDAGAGDYALSLLTSTSVRSWYNMIRVGSTITLEAWDNVYKPNQDWNHAWGAAPANLISRKLMGIEPTQPGWSRFRIKPQPSRLSSAEIIVPTIKGAVSMSFNQAEGKRFLMKLKIPANTVAEVYIPIKGKKAYSVRINGKLIEGNEIDDFFVVGEVGSGEYQLALTYNHT